MFKEFKKFAMRGNVVDLAVGVIIGSAFGKIVTSLVNDIIMPILSIIVGKINFSDLKYVIMPASGDVQEVAFRYGAFIQSVVDFLIISFSIFIFVRFLNSFSRKKTENEEASKPPKTEVLLEEIRDILKGQNNA